VNQGLKVVRVDDMSEAGKCAYACYTYHGRL